MLELERSGDKKFFQVVRISDYMETVGYMMKSKGDRRIIKDLFGDTVTSYYRRFQLWIEEQRKIHPDIYQYFAELYEFCHK